MKKNKLKIIIPVALILIAVISIYVYKEYNRKITDVDKAKTDYALTYQELVTQLSHKQSFYDSIYHFKILEVTGDVKNIDKDSKGLLTIVIGSSQSTTSIRCGLDSLTSIQLANYNAPKTITIKGIYTGFNADDMGLGADVILNRCVIKK